jgi:hypothetical protein
MRSCCLDTVEGKALVSQLHSSQSLISITHLNHSSPSLSPHSIYSYIFIFISIMNDIAKHTPPPATQPPWMLTPPRSTEKLMRALSIDPYTSTDNRTITNDSDNDYFTYLERITNPTYRDPPLPSALPRQEPLFLDEEDEDIHVGFDNRMASPVLYLR